LWLKENIKIILPRQLSGVENKKITILRLNDFRNLRSEIKNLQ
jgi:hypothetical protein